MKVEEPITDYGQLDLNKEYTYFDYMRWQFKERVELIKGKIYKMSPAPSRRHQENLREVTRVFMSYFHNHSCKLYFAPFDVRLPIPKGKKDSTVVQPDLCVICDLSKLDDQGCNGAPDLVVEILSPGNSALEMKTKMDLYEECGVQEYWVVEPANKAILVYTLRQGNYIGLKPFIEGMDVASPLFPTLKVAVTDIFHTD